MEGRAVHRGWRGRGGVDVLCTLFFELNGFVILVVVKAFL